MRGLNAKRFTGKPLKQPSYSFRDVPKASRDLSDSVLLEVSDRDYLNECMSEIVLLCNEAIRRNAIASTQKQNKKKKGYSKPLSLEYIADRMDVDDPLWGFMVRKEQQLQGFITVTTFTNWQKTFRWDSMHDSAFSYDDHNLSKKMAQGKRKYDTDGNLAEQLQATVRCGDPWNEGIVWPRIAEISLLGGLGCGKVSTRNCIIRGSLVLFRLVSVSVLVLFPFVCSFSLHTTVLVLLVSVYSRNTALLCSFFPAGTLVASH